MPKMLACCALSSAAACRPPGALKAAVGKCGSISRASKDPMAQPGRPRAALYNRGMSRQRIRGRVARGLKLGLVLCVAAGMLACGSLGINPNSLSGTAQALAQTAQVGAGTAFAGVPGTAPALGA